MHSLKPLDLSRPPTTEELMAAGQLGGRLYPTSDEDTNISVKNIINFSFGAAIQEWNKHNYKGAIKLFKKHIEDFPDSPWVSEARLHIGCDAKYNGRYTEAEEQFRWIMENNKGKSNDGAKRLRTKAMLRLGVLKVLQNNLSEATDTFAGLKQESPDWRERTYASHWIQRISRYKAGGLAMFKCGTEALAYLMEKEGKKVEAGEVAEIAPDTDNGHSIFSLVDIASRYDHELAGLQLSVSELNKIPLPAIMQITGKNGGDKGHYWVLDHMTDTGLELYDPQSGRRFLQNSEEFSKEWTGKALVSASKIPAAFSGKILSADEMKSSHGACCGVPPPEAGLGDDDSNNDDDNNNECSKGSPVWKVNKINMNLFLTDTPLWYKPPIGPSVNIRLSYNSQSAIAYSEPFGNKWQFNYGSYLVVDTGGNVTIFMPDGRRDVYAPNGQGGYTKPFGVFNVLTKIAENHFELRFPDDTVYVYNIPAGTSSLQPFLVQIRDPYGQALTFGYNSSIQLTTITDALNRSTTLTYNGNGLVERIDDPFGRFVTFEYDQNRNLTRAVDMGGYWTKYSYDYDMYLTSLENDRGKWFFYTEPADGIRSRYDVYPPPGAIMWESYRLTITNPLGAKEEFFYYGITPAGYSWHVSPRDYVPFVDFNQNNQWVAPKTLYYLTTLNQKGRISKIEYPEGGYTEFQYDTATGKRTTVTDYHGNDAGGSPIRHSTQYSYNDKGLVTSFTDAKNKTTTTAYYPNNVDVHTVTNGLGTISYTYNSAHAVTSITDRMNNLTAFSYNGYGQLTSMTEAQGTANQRNTEHVYDPASHNLMEIKKAGSTVTTFSYDGVGRVRTLTDAKGLTLTYDYNNLDQVTKITYPDTKFETFTYSTCCPRLLDSKTDRSGLTTSYTYDALKRLTQAQGPEGTVGYAYDPNGNRTKLIDADHKETTFQYNFDNRLKKKIYADGKFVTYTYDLTGLLTKFTNSRNIEKNFTYDPNHNLLTVDYSDVTPDVAYTYDDYNRVSTRIDGIGLWQYGYDANNRLTSVDGPWANDTITYQYDELGQLKNLIPQGGQTVTYNYDTIGRLANIQSGPNTYTYGYTNVNPLIQSLTRPNGSITEYLYNDSLKRLTEVFNKNSSLQVINSYAYSYNNLDLKGSETINNGNPITNFTEGLVTYNYNNLDQLLSSTNPNKLYAYDDDGNMTQGYNPEGYVMNMTYDGENRLKSAEYTDGDSVMHRTEYYYSGDNLLAEVKKYTNGSPTSDIRFVRDRFLAIQERDGSNNVTREYKWGIDEGGGIGGLLNLNQGGMNYSYLYDGKGNVTALMNSSQNIVAAYSYDPFGKLMNKTGTLNQPYMFSTKEYDLETGLSYYGYRFYSSSLGRWMTRDPIEEAGGINLYGFISEDPIGLDGGDVNFFTYVSNDPVNNIDPDGLRWQSRETPPGWWYMPPPPPRVPGAGEPPGGRYPCVRMRVKVCDVRICNGEEVKDKCFVKDIGNCYCLKYHYELHLVCGGKDYGP